MHKFVSAKNFRKKFVCKTRSTYYVYLRQISDKLSLQLLATIIPTAECEVFDLNVQISNLSHNYVISKFSQTLEIQQ